MNITVKINIKLFLLVFIFISSCTYNRDNKQKEYLNSVTLNKEHVIGCWKLLEINTVYGDYIIEIYKDNKFCFISNGTDSCYGLWDINRGEIVLQNDSSNFSNYYGFSLFYYDCEEPISDSVDIQSIKKNTKIGYKYFVYFNNEHFKFCNDSLIYIHKPQTICKDSVVFIKIGC